ncbi:unnamed protein product [Soboliphyme baturini]|uniref:ER membrane protein complex subunit 1 n=1 Tax=Soboliphyme baturini TaxID=241478 RepID=A0A183IUS2_9BILA|nr:unnamed protein product [Soboliphyme baturini]
MEMTVLELYEGYEQLDSSQFSSQRKLLPLVLQQTYIFPQGLSAIAVTETEKAITPRHLLLAMPFGGILEMPKSFLDPRRVLLPTVEQR